MAVALHVGPCRDPFSVPVDSATSRCQRATTGGKAPCSSAVWQSGLVSAGGLTEVSLDVFGVRNQTDSDRVLLTG